MKAIRLRTEYLIDPIGIDVTTPRLMWNCSDGVKQTAYRIVCSDEKGAPLWDTGKVESSSMRTRYAGKPLTDRAVVNWNVTLWDENDKQGASACACFEIGISDWQAKWITGNYTVNKKQRYPVDCFRRSFHLEKPVRKARLYITACGLYEAKINGSRVGDFCLAPGYTDYRKRVQYQTYDVTSLLAAGENTLTVQLADGWYRGSCGAWGIRNQYGTETKLLAQLEICYADGSGSTVVSDESWNWSSDGPIRFADNKDGETVDARMVPSYSGKAKITSHPVKPTASNNVPVTEHERFHPTVTVAPNGKKLLDFGQNLAGFVSFRVKARDGQKMLWRFGEMLDADGNLTLKNIQLSRKDKTTPLQQIEYTCADGWNGYKTTFAVFGFQYAEVETEVELNAENIVSIAVYSDLEQTLSFDCSHPLLNRFVLSTVWSAKSNHLDIPTDCPTRERHGWTGDAQIFFETASYLFSFAPFARKYLHDLFDWQEKSGRLPHIAPDGGADFYMRPMNGSVGWADAGILIPYRYWKLFGDEDILREFYDGMAKYARFMEKRCGRRMPVFGERLHLSKANRRYLVNSGQSYGEWAEPEDVCAFKWTDFIAPHPEVSTAYTCYVLRLMAEIAEHLGYMQDAEEFRTYSGGCKKAYQELVSDGKYALDTDRQAQLVRPLALGLLNEKQKAYAQRRLIQALENYGWRLGTGFLSTPLILDVLAETDIEAAYRLLENEQIPGWLSMPKAGATTIWEAWEGPASTKGGIGSLNHYSKGAVCEWLFRTMCGIRVDGENHFSLVPRPGKHFTHASAAYDSVYGRVESRWERKDGKTVFHFQIPSNCTAEISLPDGTKKTILAGEHSFTCEQ